MNSVISETTPPRSDRKGSRSVTVRLVGASLLLIAVALLLTGVLLIVLFRAQMQRNFDQTLRDHLEELVSAVKVGPGGNLALTWEPADRRFKRPLSGWYWELRTDGKSLKRSPSLKGHSIAVNTPEKADGAVHKFLRVKAPDGEQIRVVVRRTTLSGHPRPFAILVAAPCITIRQDVHMFARQLTISLMVLGVLLGALTILQVGYGLRPLRQMQATLSHVRSGRQPRLDGGSAAAEVAPLVDELNALLSEREATVERAHAEAGDLAHALKTPIAVIHNEARGVTGQSGEVLKAETEKMRRVVERHLVNARVKAGRRLPGTRASLDAVLDDVRFSMSRLYPEHTLTFEAPQGLTFAGANDDLGEMVGNLADNACKWARQAVVIRAAQRDGRLEIRVEDDGPGLPEEAHGQVLLRGGRLSDAVPGHGLGLAIAVELVELYSGSLWLGRSSLGGLSAVLDLPAAE
ncbi:MAG: sensor histidine kinase [Alphaproteobacteria bacterium]